ncbi:MAG TPA: efflux transporter outer membrane subunit [Geomonas sp.]|nr:efflux transporter outer membrane subunit [Geomonas sp.]
MSTSYIHTTASRLLRLLLMVCLGGCASFTHTTVPVSKPLATRQLNAGSALQALTRKPGPWPSQRWWRVFGDPQLDRLVAQATSGSPTLRMAQARVAQVKALGGVARSSLFPALQADASFSRDRFTENQFIPPPYAGNWSWNNQAALGLSYDLDLWGKNRASLAAALDYVQVASAEEKEVQLALETAVVRSYLGLALQYRLLEIARSTLHQREEILAIARKRLAAGLGSELDVKLAETPIPSSRADIERALESIELLRNQLSALAGKGPGDGETISPPSIKPARPIGLPAALPADLLGRRPDVVAQRWRVEAAGKGIEVARAAFYPNINLSAFAGWQSLGFDKFLSPGSLMAGFTPAVSLPIFEGGRLRSLLNASNAEYDIAVESYNSTLVRALQGVADQVVTLRSLAVQRTEAGLSRALADRSYQIALQGFKAGFTEYLSVLNAQSQTFEEARRDAAAEAGCQDAYAALMEALGGGVPVTTPPGTGAGG